MRRSSNSAFKSPVMIGAVTVLVVLVAVFLAYNANQGLPFVPTKELKVDIGDGSDLVAGNDVREGGFRVGLVSQMKPIELPNGQVGAQLTLQLSQAYGKVPKDSTVTIRPVSVLGTKYVELHTGTSKQLIADGGTLPIAQTSVPVQFDDVFKTFDAKTRVAIQQNLAGYGDVLAARGSDLNDTISSLPKLLNNLEPVARYLSDPGTELTRFFNSLNQFMTAIAPVTATNIKMLADMSTTFDALVRDPNGTGRSLEQTIAKSPGTLSVGTDALNNQHAFLADLTTLGTFMAPATASLRQTLPTINPAIEQGTRVLIKTPPLDQELQQVMTALQKLAKAPETNIAINGLDNTVGTLNPMIRYLGPFVTVCNDWNYWWTYFQEHISAQTTYGYAQRAMINLASIANNGVGQQGANAPANGEPNPLFGGVEYLHAQPYGAAIDSQGRADCETGQRGYPLKLNHFDPQGRNLATDVHTPGDQGPTFTGLPHVPPGETFTREPQIGPQLTPNPANP